VSSKVLIIRSFSLRSISIGTTLLLRVLGLRFQVGLSTILPLLKGYSIKVFQLKYLKERFLPIAVYRPEIYIEEY